jgi:hypothetical protein
MNRRIKMPLAVFAAYFSVLLVLPIEASAQVPSAPSCTQKKIDQILAPAKEGATSIRLDCSVSLKKGDVITKKIVTGQPLRGG